MLKFKFLILLSVIFVLNNVSFADSGTILKKKSKKICIIKDRTQQKFEIKNLMSFQESLSNNNKSYVKGILFSVLLPGGGEYYTGQYIKGAVLSAIEVVSWIAFFKFDKLGEEKEDEFETFADSHWNAADYRTWLADYINEHGNVPSHFTHTLPETKTQQYYEMIGKYDQFAPWWDDYDETSGDSEIRYDYMDVRYDSNKYLNRKRTATMVMIMNRLFSVLDTSIKIKRQKSIDVGLRYKRIYENNYGFNLTLNW